MPSQSKSERPVRNAPLAIANPQQHAPVPPAGLNLNDALYIVFRHKWKILTLAIAGISAAASVYFFFPPTYESEAKLLVRYVLDRSAIDSVDNSSSRTSDTVINSELEILTSWDLAEEVAEAIGLERLMPGSGEEVTKAAAARVIRSGLKVVARSGSNVISVSYKSENPDLPAAVLRELLNRYFTKHLEVHRSAGAFDFVSQQTDQIRARLRVTEDELTKMKGEAGILSVPESTANVNASVAKGRDDLLVAEADLAEQQARIKELEKLFPSADAVQPKAAVEKKPEDAPAPVTGNEIERYQALASQLSDLRKREVELLSRYTPASAAVKLVQSQIRDADNQRHAMEESFPALRNALPIGASGRPLGPDIGSEKARLAALVAKVETLKSQLRETEERAGRVADAATQIMQLERRKEVEETNYKYFESSLEKARIDEALDPSKMPNISIVQNPSPAFRVTRDTKKIVMGLAAGGLGLGIAIAALIELVIDRSVRRPYELETRLGIHQTLAIPYVETNGKARRQLRNRSGKGGGGNDKSLQKAGDYPAPWDAGHFMRPYADAIRDRLIYSFEVNNMTHKPKCIAVTGCKEGAGASTLACSLSASLSETGDGKVLLVDMNLQKASAHPFFEGKPACSLEDALENGADPRFKPASKNLYLATTGAAQDGADQNIPKRLYSLLPQCKASEFDYIIFDMPPVSQTSPTLTMVGCMDKVLLVVEAEKNDRDVVKRAYGELTAARADVAAVVNKTRSRIPRWIEEQG